MPYLEEGIRQLGYKSYPSLAADAPFPGFQADGTKIALARVGGRAISLSDIPNAYLYRMAVEDIVEVSKVQMRVLQESKYDYKQAAADFQVRRPARSCLVSPCSVSPSAPAEAYLNLPTGQRIPQSAMNTSSSPSIPGPFPAPALSPTSSPARLNLDPPLITPQHLPRHLAHTLLTRTDDLARLPEDVLDRISVLLLHD